MIGDGLADLHGQHQHQALLDTNKHIEYLDSFGGLIELVEKVGDSFKSLKDKMEQLRILREQEKKDQERKELSVFQVEEIKKAGLEPDEEQKLLERKRVLENAEELHRLVSSVSAGLYEDDDSVAEKLSFHWDELKKAAELDSKLKEHLQNLESALIQVEETSRILSKYKESIDFDAGELEKIADRLDLINHLKKKYGQSVQEIFGYAKKIEQDLEKISSRAEDIRQKESEVEKLTAELKTQTILLSSKRKDRGVELSKRIQKELFYLGMEKTKFEVRISATLDEFGLLKVDGKKYYVDEKGMDRVEFFVCPNPGEELKPLAKIASGGEISRIMLALKVILSKMDHINTLVFDEIDVGIGGQVAQAVGGKLKSLACDCQVICITHLQQIASQADHHFKVFKEMSEKRMITKLKQLNSTERVEEIARLISGKKITPIALKQAAQMIEEGKSH
jgi:DNA repair protein RecN (Recombination protein N)